MAELENELIAKVAQFAAVRPNKISGEARLYHDLGLAGDDLWELLEEITVRWKVDLTGMNFSHFAPGEGDWPDWPWPFNKRTPHIPLTVSDLAELIETGA